MASWTLNDLKAKGFAVNGGVAKKAIPEKRLLPTLDDRKYLYECFIPGNVPSSKNSRILGTNKKTGNPISLMSEVCQRYKKESKPFYERYVHDFLNVTQGLKLPLRVEFRFVRKTKGKFDFHNAVQIVADLMRDYGWIVDDDVDNLLIAPALVDAVIYDSLNPGIQIIICQQ